MTRTLSSMRKLSALTKPIPSLRSGSVVWHTPRLLVEHNPPLSVSSLSPSRSLAQVRQEPLSELWFAPSRPARSPVDDLLGNNGRPGDSGDHKPPDERTLKLGKTLRTLSPLLPNILTQPLPPSILSPNVSLHLFPSTHPHLPAVKGKVPYRAALLTAPVAWGCVPIVGNVKLHILSERIVRTGYIPQPQVDGDHPSGLGEEKLVVRWKTEKKGNGAPSSSNATATAAAAPAVPGSGNANSDATTAVNRGLSALLGGDKPIFTLNRGDEFSGIFVFTFDQAGCIATHTIEHADESNGTDKTSRVVTLTDWLLGRAKWRRKEEDGMIPGLAMNLRVCREEWARRGK